MIRFISMALILLVSLIVICTAEIVPFNGITTTEIMNRLPVLLTPASYVFIIWIIIYIFLVIWLFGFWRNQRPQSGKVFNIRFSFFIISLLFNMSFILLWHYEFFMWAIIVMVGLLLTISALYFSYPKTENLISFRVPISILFGWSLFSFIILINYTLIFAEWSGFGISQALWAVIFLTLATAIALHFLYHYEDKAFNIVFMWGFIGIAVKNGFDSLFVTTAALFLTAVIGACFYLFKNKQVSASK
ncbi:tryptophan-rich sensory protein [Sporosarcina ureilytica]|uniref:Tryptophan-rich sensory protein n=1 Tax=Sporosarcina ureilytica TaxID=298596 RepID=A0A1D8JDM4_9BACL|nr:tryptophan-rich sensory protein [Sporosarcina ureilytica]AOV06822.1 hypothetical protein BI350_03955 [Sporosarcina ureilytica]